MKCTIYQKSIEASARPGALEAKEMMQDDWFEFYATDDVKEAIRELKNANEPAHIERGAYGPFARKAIAFVEVSGEPDWLSVEDLEKLAKEEA